MFDICSKWGKKNRFILIAGHFF